MIAKIAMMGWQIKDRQASIRSSKASILGHIKEQMAPLQSWFPYHTKDMVFIGKWIDYIVFDGMSEGRLKKIVFVEIKSWGSTQNRNEKQVENVIDAKLVRYEIIRL